MLEAVSNLLREINAILSALARNGRIQKPSSFIVTRIQELAITWFTSTEPELGSIGVPKEVLDRVHRLTSRLAAEASERPTSQRLQSALKALWKSLHEQVILEIAEIPAATREAFKPSAPARLFPEITDLPNEFVPRSIHGWSDKIKAFLQANQFSQNVFIMVSYRPQLKKLTDAVINKLQSLSLNPILAKDHALTDDLYNPVACLLCCSYGVAIFDRAETAQTHNPNVVYELGMMHMLSRPCIILKHRNLKTMPTDLLSRLYEHYSSAEEAVLRVGEWWARITI